MPLNKAQGLEKFIKANSLAFTELFTHSFIVPPTVIIHIMSLSAVNKASFIVHDRGHGVGYYGSRSYRG